MEGSGDPAESSASSRVGLAELSRLAGLGLRARRSERVSPALLGVGVGLGLMAGFVVLSIVGGLFALISLGMLLNSITKDGASTSLERVWGTEGASGHLRAIRISGTIMTDAADGALLSSGTYGYEVADQLDSLK